MRRPFFTTEPDTSVVLGFPYNQLLIEAIKQAVPHASRKYDPEDKTWWVDQFYADEALRIFRIYYPGVEEQRQQGFWQEQASSGWPGSGSARPPAAKVSGDDPFAVLFLLPTAPRCVIEAAYKALAKHFHPDVSSIGTDAANRKMADINRAVTTLRDRVAS